MMSVIMGFRLQQFLFISLWLGLLAQAPGTWAHESRPAYLEITETTPGRYSVLWRIPLLAGMRLPVVLKFPNNVQQCYGTRTTGVAGFIHRTAVGRSERQWPGRKAHRIRGAASYDHRRFDAGAASRWCILDDVGASVAVLALAKRMKLPAMVGRYALPVATYTIGILAAFWFFERLARFAT